jgi:hypothetical protein
MGNKIQLVRTDSGMVVDEPDEPVSYVLQERKLGRGGVGPTIPPRCFCQYYLKCILLLITMSNLNYTCLVVRYL